MAQSSIRTSDLWSDVLTALDNKKCDPKNYDRIYIGKIETASAPIHLKSYTKPSRVSDKIKYYKLDLDCINVEFTRREAEVMVLIMEGYTNREAAAILGLSPRTTEFYIRNMRKKTNTLNKSQLISMVAKTNFMRHIDFTINAKAGVK